MFDLKNIYFINLNYELPKKLHSWIQKAIVRCAWSQKTQHKRP